MITYTVSFTLSAPEAVPRLDVEEAVREACNEFHVGDSTLWPINFSITAIVKKVGS